MAKITPVAFMSYVHWDDKYGQVTTLRGRLSDEVQVQTGIEFPIFQDRNDINWGQNWRERIDSSVDQVTFLIPIITPGFFNSEECRKELERFIEREKKLGRSDLILPVYFVDTPLLNEPGLRTTDELAKVIASRQYADWRELRFEPFTNPLVGKTLAQLAVQIRKSLPIHGSKPSPSKPPATNDAQPKVAATDDGGKQATKNLTTNREPPTCIVDPMHRGDFDTINSAIKNVEPGTRILVKPGLYQEALLIDKPLEIIGDGASGEIVIQMKRQDVIVFQTTMGRVANLTLRQTGGNNWYCVSIAQGRLELEDCDITSQSLSCIGIYGSADPRLRRNRIHDSKHGCGVLLYENAQGTLEDNNIFGNGILGVSIEDRANPSLRRNRIYENKNSGLAVANGGQGIFDDNDIFSNPLSGVLIETKANPTLRRNRIRDNKQCGIHIYLGGRGIIEYNDILRNGYSGITSREGSNPAVKNNRINKNLQFGIEVYENGGGTFEDNDLTENASGALYITPQSKANVTLDNNKGVAAKGTKAQK